MTETSEKPHGKGRPTPKRSEATKGRRQPLVTPRTKGRSKSDRAERAELRRAMREAMRNGDERYLPPIARGPERALVRDVVDSRRSYAWLSIPGWMVGLVLSSIKFPVTQVAGSVVLTLVVGILIADSVATGKVVRRALRERWPGGTEGSTKGLTYYAVARNMQPRRWRRPPAKVARGEAPR